jgi:hypothetical protein
MIKLLGTTDNYNTETTERLHIDLAKDAYRATNKKEYYEQMLLWLERREKIWAFDVVLQWRTGNLPKPRSRYLRRHPLGPRLAMTPSHSNVSILTLARNHGATSFIPELRKFITQWNKTSVLASHRSNHLCITHIDVWYLLKFYVKQSSLSSLAHETVHIAYANPERKGSKKMLPARFDTVLVSEGDAVDGKGIHGAHTNKCPPSFNS